MKGKEAGLFDNKALASLILPLLVEQFLAVLVGMADSIMVASVGEAAVSGVSLVDNVMVLFINLFAALATGGAVIAGQYLGQEDRKSSGKAATQLIWFMTAVSFGIMMLIYLGKNFILHQIFGAIEADVCAHANTYLLIVAASVPFLAIYNGGAAGDAKVTMYISIASMWFCRIVMSYVLGKYLGMGVFGVWAAMIFDWCVRFVAMTFRYRQGKWKQIDSLA